MRLRLPKTSLDELDLFGPFHRRAQCNREKTGAQMLLLHSVSGDQRCQPPNTCFRKFQRNSVVVWEASMASTQRGPKLTFLDWLIVICNAVTQESDVQ